MGKDENGKGRAMAYARAPYPAVVLSERRVRGCRQWRGRQKRGGVGCWVKVGRGNDRLFPASAHASLSLPCSSLAFLGYCFSLPSLLLPVCNYTGANYPPSIARGRFPIQILDIVLRLRVFLLPMLCARLLLHLQLGISNSGFAI